MLLFRPSSLLLGRAPRHGSDNRKRLGQANRQSSSSPKAHMSAAPVVSSQSTHPLPPSEPTTSMHSSQAAMVTATSGSQHGSNNPQSWTSMLRRSFFTTNKGHHADGSNCHQIIDVKKNSDAAPTSSYEDTLQRVLCQADIFSVASVVEAFATLDALRRSTETGAQWELHARVLLALSLLGLSSRRESDASSAVSHLREVLHLYSSMGHHAHVIHVQCLLGSVYSHLGKHAYAEHSFMVALKAVEALGPDTVVEQATVGTTSNTEMLDVALPGITYAKHLQALGKHDLAIAQLKPLLELDRHHHSCISRCEMVLVTARCLSSLDRRSEAMTLLRSEIPALTMAHDSTSTSPWHNQLHSRRSIPELLAVMYAELAAHTHHFHGSASAPLHLNTSIPGAAPAEQPESAVKLFEVAVELTLGCVRRAVQTFKHDGEPFRHPEVQAVMKLHAEILFNAGVCIATNVNDRDAAAKAIAILEESVKIMDRIGFQHLTPRLRLQYVGVLRQVGFVEAALNELMTTLKIVGSVETSTATTSPPLSMYTRSGLSITLIGQHMDPHPRTVTISEVHTHIAHCLHFAVGDFVRAHDHYISALRTCHHPEVESMVETWESAHGGKRTERDPLHDCSPYEAVLNVEPRLRADTLSWLLESCADCMRRLQHSDHALELLGVRLDIGRSVGDDCVSALVAISSVLELIPERAQEARKVFDQMIALPQDAMTTLERLDLVIRYANFSNYTLQDFAKATELYTLALELDSLNPMLLVQMGWCARQLPLDAQPSVNHLTAVYMKALTSMEILKADAQLQEQRRTKATTPRAGDAEQKHKNFWTPHFDEFFVLSEAARYFHEVLRDASKAESLYAQAMEISETAPPTSVAHVLANYAILKSYVVGDQQAADALFIKALAINPANFVVSNLYSDFLIASSTSSGSDGGDDNNAAALQHIRQMIELFPDQSAVIYHKLARLEERNGNMGDEEARAGALVSYMIAASGDRDLEASALSDEKVLSIVARCADLNLINNVIAFIQSRLKSLPLAEQCSAAVYPRLRSHTTFLINYGRLCLDIGNVAQASQLLTEAYLLQPTDAVVIEHYADLIASIDRRQAPAAERLHLACLQMHPHDAAAHLAYAVFLTIHLSSPVVATKHFKTALSLQPSDPNIWSQYAAFAERQAVAIGSTSKGFSDIMFEAEKAFNKARELSLDSPATLLASGLFYMRSKRSSEAWSNLKVAYEKAPNNHAIVSSCAIFLHDRHNNVASHKQALSSTVDPTVETKQLAELSDKLYRKAIKIDPNDVHVVTQYAKFVEEVLQRPSDARKWMDHINHITAKKHAAQQADKKTPQPGDDGGDTPKE